MTDLEKIDARITAVDEVAADLNKKYATSQQNNGQGVAEEQVEESSPEALVKIDELTRR